MYRLTRGAFWSSAESCWAVCSVSMNSRSVGSIWTWLVSAHVEHRAEHVQVECRLGLVRFLDRRSDPQVAHLAHLRRGFFEEHVRGDQRASLPARFGLHPQQRLIEAVCVGLSRQGATTAVRHDSRAGLPRACPTPAAQIAVSPKSISQTTTSDSAN